MTAENNSNCEKVCTSEKNIRGTIQNLKQALKTTAKFPLTSVASEFYPQNLELKHKRCVKEMRNTS